jgi:hypothetical protein
MTPLSARTVATFLASQEDPESGLCPNKQVVPIDLGHTKGHHRRRSTLSTEEGRSTQSRHEGHGHHYSSSSTPLNNINERTEDTTPRPNGHMNGESIGRELEIQNAAQEPRPETPQNEKEPKGKDPKSFTQNLFDTLAMRMLEWVPLRPSTRTHNKITSNGTIAVAKHANRNSQENLNDDDFQEEQKKKTLKRSPSSFEPSTGLEERIPSINGSERHTAKKRPPMISLGLRSADSFESSRREVRELQSRRSSVQKLSMTTPSHIHEPVNSPTTPPALKHRREKHNQIPNGFVPRDAPKSRRSVSWDGSKVLGAIEDSESDIAELEMKNRLRSDSSGVPSNRAEAMTSQQRKESRRHPHDTRGLVPAQPTLTYFDYTIGVEMTNMIHEAVNENETTQRRWHTSMEFPHLTPYCAGNSKLRILYDFLEQSIFYVLGFPEQILISFRMKSEDGIRKISPLPDTDLIALLHTFITLHVAKLSTSIVEALWRGLEDLFVPQPSLAPSRRSRKSTSSKGSLANGDMSNGSGSGSHKGKTFVSDIDAAHMILVGLFALSAMLPAMSDKQWTALRQARARGNALPDFPDGELWDSDGARGDSSVGDVTLIAYDALEDEMALRLLYRLVRAVSARLTAFEISKLRSKRRNATKDSEFVALKRPHVLDLVLRTLETGGAVNTEKANRRSPHFRNIPLRLVEWVRTALIKEWNGDPLTSRGTVFGSAVLVMNALHEHRKALGLDAEVFHTPRLSQTLNPMQMPGEWMGMAPDNDNVHLLDYSFLLPPSDVVVYFRSINFSSMTEAYESTIVVERLIRQMRFTEHETENPGDALRQRLNVATRAFLVLEVSREKPLEDTLDQLWKREKREMLRPLKVRIGKEINEEGIDQGGVQQELFRLIMAEVLNPEYGMFTTDERTRMSWFQPCSYEPPSKFEMIGVLFSLAVYNGLTLPVTFPLAFYRKLLGLRVKTIEHIEDGWPELAKGLEDLENWTDGDVADVFMRTYDFSFDAFGTPVNVDMTRFGRDDSWPPSQDLKGRGKEKSQRPVEGLTNIEALQIHQSESSTSNSAPGVPTSPTSPLLSHLTQFTSAPLVTNDNRSAYIKDYIHWLTTQSITSQWNAFTRGFFVCISPRALSIFTPESLQAVVEGSQYIDIDALEAATKYDDQNFMGIGAERPYTKDSKPVRWFWEVVREWDMGKRRKLLEFVTASERVPVTGSGTITFSIIRNGAGDKVGCT